MPLRTTGWSGSETTLSGGKAGLAASVRPFDDGDFRAGGVLHVVPHVGIVRVRVPNRVSPGDARSEHDCLRPPLHEHLCPRDGTCARAPPRVKKPTTSAGPVSANAPFSSDDTRKPMVSWQKSAVIRQADNAYLHRRGFGRFRAIHWWSCAEEQKSPWHCI